MEKSLLFGAILLISVSTISAMSELLGGDQYVLPSFVRKEKIKENLVELDELDKRAEEGRAGLLDRSKRERLGSKDQLKKKLERAEEQYRKDIYGCCDSCRCTIL